MRMFRVAELKLGATCTLAVALTIGVVYAQQAPDAVIAQVRAHPKFKAAMAAIDKDHDRLVREIVTLTEIPAPPFKEDARAKAYLQMLRAHGLTDVEQDPEGNAMGLRRGTGGGPLIALAAHLDTVFPEGTNVTVKRDGTRLMAPGIGDDTRSLAVLLAMVRAMDAAGIQTNSDILFIGNVGEEGPGDLRGVKVPVPEGQVQGPHQAVHLNGRRRRRRRRGARCGWEQAVPCDLQGSRWPQLRRLRPRESGVRDGQRHPQILAAHRAARAPHHLQRRRRRRRDLRELDPVRELDGRGHAIGVARGTGQARSGVQACGAGSGGRGEQRAVDGARADHRGRETHRRSSVRRDLARRADRPDGVGGDSGGGTQADVQLQQYPTRTSRSAWGSRRSPSTPAVEAAARTRSTSGSTSTRCRASRGSRSR